MVKLLFGQPNKFDDTELHVYEITKSTKMKLSEIPYQRPNMEAIGQRIQNLCIQFENAEMVNLQLKVVHQINDLQLCRIGGMYTYFESLQLANLRSPFEEQ